MNLKIILGYKNYLNIMLIFISSPNLTPMFVYYHINTYVFFVSLDFTI